MISCLDSDNENKTTHCWQQTGLANINDVLSNTRRCHWCGRQESKPYGAGSRKGWHQTTPKDTE